MPKYIGFEEHERILRLHKEGWSNRRIAEEYQVCEATIYNHIIGKTQPRFHREKIPAPEKNL